MKFHYNIIAIHSIIIIVHQPRSQGFCQVRQGAQTETLGTRLIVHLLFIVHFFHFLVISMGFGASESRLALRSCNSDITMAVGYISRKREVLLLNNQIDIHIYYIVDSKILKIHSEIFSISSLVKISIT